MAKTKNELQALLRFIAESPVRLTWKRRHLLEVLSSFDCPVGAARLRDTAGLPEGDLVTVYRTLDTFESIGIVQRIPLESGGDVFELTMPHDRHHHFLCRRCHRTERLDLRIGEQLTAQAHQLGFAEVTHTLEVYGVCKNCQDPS